MNSQELMMHSQIDPYVYQYVTSYIGKTAVVQTTQGSLRGRIQTVMPDHLVIEVSGVPFMVRLQQLVWLSPSQ
ncbi:DUF2642 domain-containing protein [Bacillus spongiae]|uniref:DUF2642 domain-containing protein n=2 Tax=Bacillus spongiae TaxID=2683610 RepID=A0ABU8HFK5_9BACI